MTYVEEIVDKVAYEVIRDEHPALLVGIARLVRWGESPKTIATRLRRHGCSEFMVRLIEGCASYIKTHKEDKE